MLLSPLLVPTLQRGNAYLVIIRTAFFYILPTVCVTTQERGNEINLST
jgi:hypothetical protein